MGGGEPKRGETQHSTWRHTWSRGTAIRQWQRVIPVSVGWAADLGMLPVSLDGMLIFHRVSRVERVPQNTTYCLEFLQERLILPWLLFRPARLRTTPSPSLRPPPPPPPRPPVPRRSIYSSLWLGEGTGTFSYRQAT